MVGVGFKPTNDEAGGFTVHPLATWIPTSQSKRRIIGFDDMEARRLYSILPSFSKLAQHLQIEKQVRMNPFPGKTVIGLTGGIASGKSTALKIFEQLGWETISVDSIVSEFLEKDERVRDTLRKRWGNELFFSGGIVDKSKIAQIIFNYFFCLINRKWRYTISFS